MVAVNSGVRRKLSWGGSFSGICWSFALGVCSLWRHSLMSFMFPNQRFGDVFRHDLHMLLHALPLPFFCVVTLNINYQRSKFEYRRKINSTLRHSSSQLQKHQATCQNGSKTHSQLQNEAALMSCRIWAVEHRKCAAGLAGAHPGLQHRILLNYTRIENAHKVRKKTFNVLLCIEV